MADGKKNIWINVKPLRSKDLPEISVDRAGRVYVDGKPYDPADERYRKLSVSVESYQKQNLGEETQKMLELQKTAKKGETVTVSETKDKDKSETTTITF